MDSQYYVELVQPDKMLQCVEAIEYGCSQKEKIGQFVYETTVLSGGARSGLNKALAMGKSLKLFAEENGQYLSVNDEGFDPKTWDEEEKKLFFKMKLQGFKPFLLFYDFISAGSTSESALMKTMVLLNLDPGTQGNKNPLSVWGCFAGIFDQQDGKLAILDSSHGAISKAKISFLENISQSLSDEVIANRYLHNLLGDEAYNFLEESVKNDLVKALVSSQKDPAHALRDAGNAIEDHLKTIAAKRNVLLKDAQNKPIQTLGRIIQELRRRKVLADHHSSSLLGLEVFVAVDVMQGLNAFRKIPSHGKNVEANMRWALSEEIATIIVLQSILAIKSTYYYAIKKNLQY